MKIYSWSVDPDGSETTIGTMSLSAHVISARGGTDHRGQPWLEITALEPEGKPNTERTFRAFDEEDTIPTGWKLSAVAHSPQGRQWFVFEKPPDRPPPRTPITKDYGP